LTRFPELLVYWIKRLCSTDEWVVHLVELSHRLPKGGGQDGFIGELRLSKRLIDGAGDFLFALPLELTVECLDSLVVGECQGLKKDVLQESFFGRFIIILRPRVRFALVALRFRSV